VVKGFARKPLIAPACLTRLENPGMKRIWIFGATGLLLLAAQNDGQIQPPKSNHTAGLSWIWVNDGNPLRDARPGTRYFRRAFALDRFVDEANLDVTAAGKFTVWINGEEVGSGNGPKRVYAYDVKNRLHNGQNLVAIQVDHANGPAGLLVRLRYLPNGTTVTSLVSDASWKVSSRAEAGWNTLDFNDGPWGDAKVLAAYGENTPWPNLTWDSGGDSRFTVPPGFRVEMAAKNPDPKDPFSLINMTFDAKGRLLVSKEQGPILLCTDPDKDGVFQKVVPYCKQVTGCQGMCWVDDALLLGGDGPKGTGLYRVRDTKGKDQTDEVTLLASYIGPSKGSAMGEHGPHAILHGPDDWLYLVNGNHSWLKTDKLAANSPLLRWPHGTMGPDQGKPGTTEDVLLPRQNDARGHAADILAPGGVIWRLDRQGKNRSMVAGGFRNHFDAAFSPRAELFTFDSDMEWDLELPWYRPVRICHCPPGADFVWRTGAANTPNYYIDSLPPIYETGRGSPVGLEFYDHTAFPQKYRGAYFLADWSLGLIHAAFLEPKGASYACRVERFCSGNPMNITDIGVAPDGSLYFTMGGRGSQGGVYRIVYAGEKQETSASSSPTVASLLNQPQLLEAWSRAALQRMWKSIGPKAGSEGLLQVTQDSAQPADKRIKALTLLQNLGKPADAHTLGQLLHDHDAAIRGHAVWLIGVNEYRQLAEPLLAALKDDDAFVRRRACEALIRAGVEVPAEPLWPLLAEEDRFLRTAARLVLQRIPPERWNSHLWTERNDLVAMEGIVALCKIDQAKSVAGPIFQRLAAVAPSGNVQRLLDQLRTLQLALVHTSERPPSVRALASLCAGLFPHGDGRVNRELAILLAYFGKEGLLDEPVHGRLLAALKASAGDRAQQIYYFYCMRFLHKGWTPEEKKALLHWYDSTKTWTGGASFNGFLENILRDMRSIFDAAELASVTQQALTMPRAATSLLRNAPRAMLPGAEILSKVYAKLPSVSLDKERKDQLKDALIDALARNTDRNAQTVLRGIGEKDASLRDTVARALSKWPTPPNYGFLVQALDSSSPVVLFDVVEALKKISTKPKPDDAAPFRRALVAGSRLDKKNRWKAVELLRHWTDDKRFGGDDGDAEAELSAWSRWFSQTFPKEPPLPNMTAAAATPSKYKFDELLHYVIHDPVGSNGDPKRGRLVFEKAQCLKCHRYGREGEGIGPDLTTVSKRFDRRYILESIMEPSKVISDQYRSMVIVTKTGQEIMGLLAPQTDGIAVITSDATKVMLKPAEIEERHVSLVSIMPEKLLDPLTKQEIADLFAFMQSEPAK
jgi:putative heme-binding domain-containing protein